MFFVNNCKNNKLHLDCTNIVIVLINSGLNYYPLNQNMIKPENNPDHSSRLKIYIKICET